MNRTSSAGSRIAAHTSRSINSREGATRAVLCPGPPFDSRHERSVRALRIVRTQPLASEIIVVCEHPLWLCVHTGVQHCFREFIVYCLVFFSSPAVLHTPIVRSTFPDLRWR